MKAARLLAVAVLVYIVPDFITPFVHGVFSFDSEHLFVDTVVQLKAPERVKPMTTGAPDRPVPVAIDAEPRALAVDRRPVLRAGQAAPRRTPEHRSLPASPSVGDDDLA
jgi:hypothetical protein